MADQVIVQVRVDKELKEQVSQIFDLIGIDIPTAVRMFFKATVREKGLPFDTNVSSQMEAVGRVEIPSRTEEKEEREEPESREARELEASEASEERGRPKTLEEMLNDPEVGDYIRSRLMYEPANFGDEDTIIVLPLNGSSIPTAMYTQLVEKVPAGKITSWESIYACLGRIYNMTVDAQPEGFMPRRRVDGSCVPYWRVVSNRGVLSDFLIITKEEQRRRLIEEGVPVVQRGSIAGSYKVENYKEYMFDFSDLRLVRR